MSKEEEDLLNSLQEEIDNRKQESAIETTTDTSSAKQEKLQKEIESIQTEIDEYLESEELTQEALKEIRVESFSRLRSFVEKRSQFKKDIAYFSSKAQEIVQKASSADISDIAVGKLYDTLEDVRTYRRESEHKLEELKHNDPESFMADALYELREHKDELAEDIVETDYVTHKKEQVREGLTENRIAALMGETGTGKTMLAEKIASEVSSDGEFEFIGGHAYMTKEDLFGYLGLKPEEVDPESVPERIDEAVEKYESEAPQDIDEDELNRAADLIRATVQGQAEQKQLQTQAVKGPVLKAAEAGRPVIIDEFNYIPADLISGINQLLIADPGDPVSFLDEQVEVADGFNVIFTGNMSSTEFSDRYEDREDVDPALINRINSGWVEYEFVPQNAEETLDNSIVDRADFKQGEEVPSRELFRIGLTKLVDEKGNLEAGPETLEELWNLAGGMSLLQNAYLGKAEETDVDMPSDVGATIQDYPVSMRDFIDVLEDWQRSNFTQSPDFSIYKKLIRPASASSSQAAAKMFFLLKERLGFFSDEVWDDIDYDLDYGDITGLEKIEQNESAVQEQLEKDVEPEFYTPEEIAESYHGVETPPLTTEDEKRQETNIEREFVLEVEEQIDSIETRLDNLSETVDAFCDDEEVILGDEA